MEYTGKNAVRKEGWYSINQAQLVRLLARMPSLCTHLVSNKDDETSFKNIPDCIQTAGAVEGRLNEVKLECNQTAERVLTGPPLLLTQQQISSESRQNESMCCSVSTEIYRFYPHD